MVNLLSNAVKFTTRSWAASTVVGRRDDDSVRVTVRDTGVGIANEDRERVFEEFEQADRRPRPGRALAWGSRWHAASSRPIRAG